MWCRLARRSSYAIELDWDYAYLPSTATPVADQPVDAPTRTVRTSGNGITGSSGGAWVDLTADLSAFAGQTVTLGFRYWTDGARVGSGFLVDDLAITGQPLDGAEAAAGWTFDRVPGDDGDRGVGSYFNAYVVENRQYTGYDLGLKTGPYNFGFLDNPLLQNYVERFPYQDGVLISVLGQLVQPTTAR